MTIVVRYPSGSPQGSSSNMTIRLARGGVCGSARRAPTGVVSHLLVSSLLRFRCSLGLCGSWPAACLQGSHPPFQTLVVLAGLDASSSSGGGRGAGMSTLGEGQGIHGPPSRAEAAGLTCALMTSWLLRMSCRSWYMARKPATPKPTRNEPALARSSIVPKPTPRSKYASSCCFLRTDAPIYVQMISVGTPL